MDIKNLALLQLHGPKSGMDLVIDVRKMTKTKGASPKLSTLVHPDCGWSKGHMLHVFNERKCVLSLVLALSGATKGFVEGGAKRMLEPVQMAQCMDVEYETAPSQQQDEASQPQTMAAPKPQKKKVKTSPSEPL